MNTDTFLLFWLPLGLVEFVISYDGYTTCSKPFRIPKSRHQFPCDFKNENWCIMPGSAYPWHAVRRFVFENHGLMKRMYGEQRHISVLRAEIDTNDVDYGNDGFGWRGYNEDSAKKYQKPDSVIRQGFTTTSTTSSSTTSTSTTTEQTTVFSTQTSPKTTVTTPIIPNSTSTLMDALYSTVDDEENTTINESTEDSTVSDELPFSTTTTTQPTTSSQPQMFQEATSELPPIKLKGINACPVKEEVVAPFWANNTRGEILALLNLYPFEQYVHWERCTYENKQMYCRQGCRCEQQYRLHRLLAYDPSNDCRGIFSDWFKFPSCCVCKCYDIPNDLRLTSRSPRGKHQKFSVPGG